MLNVIFLIITAYLVGSLPTAIIAGRLLKKIDIREHGSGNAGATNVFRVLGWKAGLVVLAIDIFKGFVVVQWLVGIVDYNIESLVYFQLIAGISAIFGHIWTIFAGFKGGKGVGTAAGVCLGLQPFAVFICLLLLQLVSKLVLQRNRARGSWSRPEVEKARRRAGARREPFSPITLIHGLRSRLQPKVVWKPAATMVWPHYGPGLLDRSCPVPSENLT